MDAQRGGLEPHEGTLVEVAADRRKDGQPVYETLWAEGLPGGTYRLVRTPLVAQGLAAGDEFEVNPSDRAFRVLRRSGNLSVQLFMSPELTADVLDTLTPAVVALGGGLDAHTKAIAGFRIPVSVGFQPIEQLFGEFVATHAHAEWLFSNVYDAEGRPLNWW